MPGGPGTGARGPDGVVPPGDGAAKDGRPGGNPGAAETPRPGAPGRHARGRRTQPLQAGSRSRGRIEIAPTFTPTGAPPIMGSVYSSIPDDHHSAFIFSFLVVRGSPASPRAEPGNRHARRKGAIQACAFRASVQRALYGCGARGGPARSGHLRLRGREEVHPRS